MSIEMPVYHHLLARKLLDKLQNEGLIYLKQNSVEVESDGRLKLAVKAASLGADLENISNLLCWQEFEEMTAFALKKNGYTVSNNVRFKSASRRWEIDVVGLQETLSHLYRLQTLATCHCSFSFEENR